MKACLDCGLPASDATHYKPPSFKGLYSSRCRECDKARAREWKLANAEQNKRTLRKWSLASNYGITPEQWDEMFDRQGGRCAVCRTPDPGARTFHVDHDHVTMRVRGLLCHRCNTAYTAHLEEHMDAMYEYHKEHKAAAIEVLGYE